MISNSTDQWLRMGCHPQAYILLMLIFVVSIFVAIRLTSLFAIWCLQNQLNQIVLPIRMLQSTLSTHLTVEGSILGLHHQTASKHHQRQLGLALHYWQNITPSSALFHQHQDFRICPKKKHSLSSPKTQKLHWHATVMRVLCSTINPLPLPRLYIFYM